MTPRSHGLTGCGTARNYRRVLSDKSCPCPIGPLALSFTGGVAEGVVSVARQLVEVIAQREQEEHE